MEAEFQPQDPSLIPSSPSNVFDSFENANTGLFGSINWDWNWEQATGEEVNDRESKCSQRASYYGRGGTPKCTRCRKSRKKCIPKDATLPLVPPCLNCHKAGKGGECDGPILPPTRRNREIAPESDDSPNISRQEFADFQSQVFSELNNLGSQLTTLLSRTNEIHNMISHLSTGEMSSGNIREEVNFEDYRFLDPRNHEYLRTQQSTFGLWRTLSRSISHSINSAPSPAITGSPSSLVYQPPQNVSRHPEVTGTQHLYPDYPTILRTISAIVDAARAMRIAKDLERYFQDQQTPISHLRVASVPKLQDEAIIIEWREDQHTDVLAFCKIPDGSLPCSWFMHVGVRGRLANVRSWNHATIKWLVSDIGHLIELLQVAQKILGLLQWSDDLKRSCRERFKDCSQEEFQKQINLLVEHELQTKEDHNTSIGASASLLEAVSIKQG